MTDRVFFEPEDYNSSDNSGEEWLCKSSCVQQAQHLPYCKCKLDPDYGQFDARNSRDIRHRCLVLLGRLWLFVITVLNIDCFQYTSISSQREKKKVHRHKPGKSVLHIFPSHNIHRHLWSAVFNLFYSILSGKAAARTFDFGMMMVSWWWWRKEAHCVSAWTRPDGGSPKFTKGHCRNRWA